MDDLRALSGGIGTARETAPAEARAREGAGAAEGEREKKLRKACTDFEAIFISLLFQTMRKTVPASGYLQAMPGKDVYTMMMDQKLAEDLARKGGGIGLQKILYHQLNRPIRQDREPSDAP